MGDSDSGARPVMLHVVLIDATGTHHHLGALPTNDPDLASFANRGRVVKLLRCHPTPVRPADVQFLTYLDGHRLARLWRGRTLLGQLATADE